jgi:selenide,water dikinase
LSTEAYADLIEATTKLNTPGPELAALDGVHALTDVTGFGLAGHALELARGAKLAVHLDWPAVPLLPGVRALAEQGLVTGASGRNWASYGGEVSLGDGLSDLDRALLTDPQTAGGLLVSCTPEALPAVHAVFERHGFMHSAVVGRVEPGQGLHVHG